MYKHFNERSSTYALTLFLSVHICLHRQCPSLKKHFEEESLHFIENTVSII